MVGGGNDKKNICDSARVSALYFANEHRHHRMSGVPAMAKTKGSKPSKRELEQLAKAPSPPAPKWPAFKPALPVTSLSLEEVHPAFRDKILLVRNFFPKSLCRDYVTYLRGLPFVTTPGRPKRGEAVRVNDRYQIDDLQFAQRLWLETGLKDLLLDDSVSSTWNGEVVGLNPNIRIYRYSQNQFFDAHCTSVLYLSSPACDLGRPREREGFRSRSVPEKANLSTRR